MQQADKAYAEASKAANTKRQQATDAKNLAGEPGVRELQQAETNLSTAIMAVTDATNAKAAKDKAVTDAKAAVLPLQQAYDAAEKTAKEAEAAAKAASDAANQLEDAARKVTAEAESKRKAADDAKAALAHARQGEQQAQALAAAAGQKLAEGVAHKKLTDELLGSVKKQVAEAATQSQAAETAAQEAEARAKQIPRMRPNRRRKRSRPRRRGRKA